MKKLTFIVFIFQVLLYEKGTCKPELETWDSSTNSSNSGHIDISKNDLAIALGCGFAGLAILVFLIFCYLRRVTRKRRQEGQGDSDSVYVVLPNGQTIQGHRVGNDVNITGTSPEDIYSMGQGPIPPPRIVDDDDAYSRIVESLYASIPADKVLSIPMDDLQPSSGNSSGTSHYVKGFSGPFMLNPAYGNYLFNEYGQAMPAGGYINHIQRQAEYASSNSLYGSHPSMSANQSIYGIYGQPGLYGSQHGVLGTLAPEVLYGSHQGNQAGGQQGNQAGPAGVNVAPGDSASVEPEEKTGQAEEANVDNTEEPAANQPNEQSSSVLRNDAGVPVPGVPAVPPVPHFMPPVIMPVLPGPTMPALGYRNPGLMHNNDFIYVIDPESGFRSRVFQYPRVVAGQVPPQPGPAAGVSPQDVASASAASQPSSEPQPSTSNSQSSQSCPHDTPPQPSTSRIQTLPLPSVPQSAAAPDRSAECDETGDPRPSTSASQDASQSSASSSASVSSASPLAAARPVVFAPPRLGYAVPNVPAVAPAGAGGDVPTVIRRFNADTGEEYIYTLAVSRLPRHQNSRL